MPNNNTQQFKRSERLIELGRILFKQYLHENKD